MLRDTKPKHSSAANTPSKPVTTPTSMHFKSSKSASALCPPTQLALRSLLGSSSRSSRRSRSVPTRHCSLGSSKKDAGQPRPHTATAGAAKSLPTGLGERASKYADAWGIQLLPLVTKPEFPDGAGVHASGQGKVEPEDEQDLEQVVKDLIRKEASYVAASHRADRPLSRRIESAQKAADLHEQRTGRRLRVTAQFVEEGMVYPEM